MKKITILNKYVSKDVVTKGERQTLGKSRVYSCFFMSGAIFKRSKVYSAVIKHIVNTEHFSEMDLELLNYRDLGLQLSILHIQPKARYLTEIKNAIRNGNLEDLGEDYRQDTHMAQIINQLRTKIKDTNIFLSNLIIVRSLSSNDLARWKPLWEGYNRFYGRNSMPPEITQTTWSRFFDDSEPMYALVAEKNGELLGLAHYLFHRSTTKIELTCYLQDLFTDETARGQGIGRKLIEIVYVRAKEAGSHRVYWQTQDNNLIARKLYDQVAEPSDFIVYCKQV